MRYLYRLRLRLRGGVVYSLLWGLSFGVVLEGCGGAGSGGDNGSGGSGSGGDNGSGGNGQPSTLKKLSSVEQLPAGNESSVDVLVHDAKYSKNIITYGFFQVGEKTALSSSSYPERYRESGQEESIVDDWLIAMFEEAFEDFAAATNLKFEKTEDPEQADISYFIRDYNSGLLGFSGYPSSSNGILDKDLANKKYDYNGSPLKELILHELGHGLGLRHPFKGSSYGARNRAELKGYEATTAYTLEAYADMPYGTYFDGVSEQIRYREGLGLYDIAALQKKYGANKGHKAGDNSYDEEDFKEHWIPKVIWDGGGRDVIDLSGFEFKYLEDYAKKSGKNLPIPRHEIDLRAGHFSSVGIIEQGFLPRDSIFRGHNNLAIAFGAEIEDAIGGKGDDVLIGNKLSNSLEGGEGEDILGGLEGDDILKGGVGDDILSGGTGDDTAWYKGQASSYVVVKVGVDQYMVWGADEGADLLDSIATLRFSDGNKATDEVLSEAADVARAPYVVMSAGGEFVGSFVTSGDAQWVRIRIKSYGDADGIVARLQVTIAGNGKIEGLYRSKEGSKYDNTDFSNIAIEQTKSYYLKIVAAADEPEQTYKLKLDDVSTPPDLEVENIELIAGDVAYARSFLYYKIAVANKGSIASTSGHIKVYISKDNKLDSADHYASIIPFGVIKNGASEEITSGVTVPDYYEAGEYYAIFQVDASNAILESNENNNLFVQKFKVNTRDGDRDLGVIEDNGQRIFDSVHKGDEDTFTFQLTKKSLVNLFLDRIVGNIQDLKLSIIKKQDTTATAIVRNEDSYLYNGLYKVLDAGEYELTVSSEQSYRRGYALHVSALGEDEASRDDDYSADKTTAGVLAVGGTTRGFIEKKDDEDWFRLDGLEAGKVYSIEMQGQGYGYGSLADPTIFGVVDSNGVVVTGTKNGERLALTGDKDRNTKDAEIWKFSVDTEGEYYLKLGSGDNEGGVTGSYRVFLSEQGGSAFAPLRVLNSMPDITIKADERGEQTYKVPKEMFHHYFYAVDGKRDVFELELLNGNDLPSWITFDKKTGAITINRQDVDRTTDLRYDFRINYEFTPDERATVRGSDIFTVRVEGATTSFEEEDQAGFLGSSWGDDGLF